jgi:DNA polymerase-1
MAGSPRQRLYGGVRLLGEGPSLLNVARLDAGAVPMLHAMRTRGLQVDLGHFATIEQEFTLEMERLTDEVSAIAGHYVNPGSGDQVSHFLFKEIGLKQARTAFTKSGDRESVENEVLVAIQHDHPVVAKLLLYKLYEKYRGTYARPIQRLAKRTAFGQWRVFPNLKDTRVPSGRFSCDEPNLLAQPNRTKAGRRLIEGFITDPGWVLLSVDESQIEPRTVAHRSQDPAMMAVYQQREDIYSDFATAAFALKDERHQVEGKWEYPTVDKKEHRFPAKTCILASIYRVTNTGLLEQMPTICEHCHQPSADHDPSCLLFKPLWNEDNCQDLINSFYLKYHRISAMQREDDKRVRQFTYTWDDFGRLLHVTAVRSVHPWVVSAALREAGNMPIQGFACGTLKLVMAQVQYELTEAGLYGDVWWPLLPIHDEILSEVREDMAEEVGAYIADCFKHCVELRVPLEATWATAASWGTLEK